MADNKDHVIRYGAQVRAAAAIEKSLKASGVARDVRQTGHIVTFRVDDAWIAIVRIDVKHEDESA